jgi:rubrerythrin
MAALQFNADEIFTMAEQIERNGARFYRAAAKNNSPARELLQSIAEMEDRHLATFEQMHEAFSARAHDAERDTFDPEGEAAAYLSSMANGHVFDIKKDPALLLKGNETTGEIIHIAIGLEKDSIVFYLGMKELVSNRLDKKSIELIIKEEMQHITLLSNKLSEM